jgi:hypothetical protein
MYFCQEYQVKKKKMIEKYRKELFLNVILIQNTSFDLHIFSTIIIFLLSCNIVLKNCKSF